MPFDFHRTERPAASVAYFFFLGFFGTAQTPILDSDVDSVHSYFFSRQDDCLSPKREKKERRKHPSVEMKGHLFQFQFAYVICPPVPGNQRFPSEVEIHLSQVGEEKGGSDTFLIFFADQTPTPPSYTCPNYTFSSKKGNSLSSQKNENSEPNTLLSAQRCVLIYLIFASAYVICRLTFTNQKGSVASRIQICEMMKASPHILFPSFLGLENCALIESLGTPSLSHSVTQLFGPRDFFPFPENPRSPIQHRSTLKTNFRLHLFQHWVEGNGSEVLIKKGANV
jgi:hypothetical protein